MLNSKHSVDLWWVGRHLVSWLGEVVVRHVMHVAEMFARLSHNTLTATSVELIQAGTLVIKTPLSKGNLIWRCHGCGSENYCSLETDVTQCDKSLPTLWRNLLPPSSGYKKRLKIMIPGFFETLTVSYQAVWRHISESSSFDSTTISFYTVSAFGKWSVYTLMWNPLIESILRICVT